MSRIRAPADFNPRTDPPLDFPDADYGSLTPADYDTLGFMAGLEVHQQLATRSKLFAVAPRAATPTARTPRSCATCAPRSASSASTTAPP